MHNYGLNEIESIFNWSYIYRVLLKDSEHMVCIFKEGNKTNIHENLSKEDKK